MGHYFLTLFVALVLPQLALALPQPKWSNCLRGPAVFIDALSVEPYPLRPLFPTTLRLKLSSNLSYDLTWAEWNAWARSVEHPRMRFEDDGTICTPKTHFSLQCPVRSNEIRVVEQVFVIPKIAALFAGNYSAQMKLFAPNNDEIACVTLQAELTSGM